MCDGLIFFWIFLKIWKKIVSAFLYYLKNEKWFGSKFDRFQIEYRNGVFHNFEIFRARNFNIVRVVDLEFPFESEK